MTSNTENYAIWDIQWNFPGNMNLLVSDMVVIWRAWALWSSHKGVQILLVVLGVCNGVNGLSTMLIAYKAWHNAFHSPGSSIVLSLDAVGRTLTSQVADSGQINVHVQYSGEGHGL
ncbi:hypothetical protein BT96DRAFT_976975 [Gymnopus androsaceus JB14]|uniref:Uncharacterized protein n=1 Tax=Gymnopus androsaceus JB14 TaxID=1447944 RepID=A0A6A4HJA1_9AGAR|nr:hypothetical protein BT96DRAFT_976975 [Gymnopus androsaceus JB14]